MSLESIPYEGGRNREAMFTFSTPATPTPRLSKPQAAAMTPSMSHRLSRQHFTPMTRFYSAPAGFHPDSRKPAARSSFPMSQPSPMVSIVTPNTPSDLIFSFDDVYGGTPNEFSFDSGSPFLAGGSVPTMFPISCQRTEQDQTSAAYPSGVPMSPTNSTNQVLFHFITDSSQGSSVPSTPGAIDPAITLAESSAYVADPDSPLAPMFQLQGKVTSSMEVTGSQQQHQQQDFESPVFSGSDEDWPGSPSPWDLSLDIRPTPGRLWDPIREEHHSQPRNAETQLRRSFSTWSTSSNYSTRSAARGTKRPARLGFDDKRATRRRGTPESAGSCDESSRRHGADGQEAAGGSKSWKCRVPSCTASFRRPEHLSRHMRSSAHDARTPFVCELERCVDSKGRRKAFNRADNKTAHIIKTHLTPAWANKGRRDRVTADEAYALGWDALLPAARREYMRLLAANGGKGPESQLA